MTLKSKNLHIWSAWCYVSWKSTVISLKPIHFFDKIKLHNFVSTSWKLHSLTDINTYTSMENRSFYFFCTQVLVYSMIFKYRNYLELQLQLDRFFQLLVAGWGLSSCTVQRNNSVGKWMIHRHYYLALQWHMYLHLVPT